MDNPDGSVSPQNPVSPDAPATQPAIAPDTTLAAKIDALHTKHFAGSPLGWHTSLWNLVHAFKKDVKALVASLEKDI